MLTTRVCYFINWTVDKARGSNTSLTIYFLFCFFSARRTSKAQRRVARVMKLFSPSNSNESRLYNDNNNHVVPGLQMISTTSRVVTLPLPTPLLRSATWTRAATSLSFTNTKCLITVYTRYLRQTINTIQWEVEKNCSEATLLHPVSNFIYSTVVHFYHIV